LKTDIIGVEFDNVTMEEALDSTEAWIAEGRPGYCVTPNPEIVYEAAHDEAFRALLNGACLVLPDGVGVMLGAKILGTPLREKVSGVDFAEALCARMAKKGSALYLLGSKPGVAELAAEKLRAAHPGLRIVGTADGYFKDEEPIAAAVRAAKPDVLFVALGSPKQEHFMKDHLSDLGVPFLIGLGGTLDAFAGTVKRAPKWVTRIGMEWFYRLIKEPKRFKRMLRLPKFVFAVLGRRMRGESNGQADRA